jgi:uncharacterized membrane protein
MHRSQPTGPDRAGSDVAPASMPLRVADTATLADLVASLLSAAAARHSDGGLARITSATSRDLPAGLDELAAFDTVVLVNMPATAWKPEGQQALVDYVLAGGHLVVFGGPFTLGQGDFRGTPLEQVLPVRLLPGRDVVALPTPQPLRPHASTTAFSGHPAVYYVHAARPVAGAETSAWAGDWPLLVKHAAGRGHVTVFLGTPLGEPQGEETPFWKSEAWLKLCGESLCGK